MNAPNPADREFWIRHTNPLKPRVGELDLLMQADDGYIYSGRLEFKLGDPDEPKSQIIKAAAEARMKPGEQGIYH